jgi:hypothetical protein
LRDNPEPARRLTTFTVEPIGIRSYQRVNTPALRANSRRETMKKTYEAPVISTYSSDAILANLGPANAVYP